MVLIKNISRKKFFLWIAVIILIICAIPIFIFLQDKKSRKSPAIIKQVCINSTCFSVELAVTPQEQERGLMFRKNLPQNNGMLFIFPMEGQYDFWMENTEIPLDMIWINEENKIVFIANNVQPCQADKVCPSIIPDKTAEYVLEINGGISQKIGLTLGDDVSFVK